VQAAESSCTAWPERGKPTTVKAKPYGRAMRGLDGFELDDAPTTLLANVGWNLRSRRFLPTIAT